MGHYELTDFEWTAIGPHLPNKSRGVARVDDRRVLNGIFWVLRSGAPWATCQSAMARRRQSTIASIAGARRHLGSADGCHCHHPQRRGADARYLDGPHPPAWCDGKKGGHDRCVGRSRGGLTTKIPALIDAQGRPLKLKLTEGQASDIASAHEMIADLPEGAMLIADKDYDANALRQSVDAKKAWAQHPAQRPTARTPSA